MPAHRKPTNVLELQGAFRRNPGRAVQRQGEPIPAKGGPGAPPSRLNADEAAAWHELLEMAHAGTFSKADRLSLEIAAQLIVEYRQSPRSFPNSRLLRLYSMLASFGMTPADRSRITVSSVKPANKFSGIGS